MESRLFQRVNLLLEKPPLPHAHFYALASAGALLANPNTSKTTQRAVVDVLSHFVCRQNADSSSLRYAVKLLGDVIALHGTFAPSINELLLPLLDGSKNAADALASLSSTDGFVLEEKLLLVLASSPSVSVRSMLVRLLLSSLDANKQIIGVTKPSFVIPVLLGLAEDIYPLIRANAVDGLASLCRQIGSGISFQIVEVLFDCAASLLRSNDEFIRLSAIRLINACGQSLERNEDGTCSTKLMDDIFVQLCVMVRDMNMKVRVEAFSALEKVHGVSENMLLQSLSKKILGTQSIKNTLIEHNLRNSKFPFSSSAGAFIHGIEDEFHEVRLAACKSLGSLANLSVQFAIGALDLLMDVLNDDSIAVRLQSLEALYKMTTNNQLVIQEQHMHMLLGLLTDVSGISRYATRKFLRCLKLPKLDIFKATISSLLTNLKAYPEEEENVFFTLFCIGMQNPKFSSKLAKDFASLVQPFGDGELILDIPRVAGQLVLIVSSTFSNKQKITNIPPVLFSYIVPLTGRISRSLGGFISQHLLSDYLFHLSGGHSSFGLPIPEETKLAAVKLGEAFVRSLKHRDQLYNSSLLLHDENLKIELNKDDLNFCHGSPFHQEGQADMSIQSIKLILRKVQETWPLIHSHCFVVALKMLSACKEELHIISSDVNGSPADFIVFALEYVLVIKLIAEIWQHMHAKIFQVTGMASFDILIEKLERSLRGIYYCFLGMSMKEESHVLELFLLCHVFRLHTVGICSHNTLKKIRATKSRLQILHEEGLSISDFIGVLNKYFTEEETESSQAFPVDKWLQLFYISPTPFCGKFKHIKGDLKALHGNSENPIRFVSGLPVGITFQFILCNIQQGKQVWLRMAVGSSIQYIFIDFYKFRDFNGVRNFSLTLPFYATPRAASFLLKACVCLELPDGDALHLNRKIGGPKHECIQISEEVVVYFVGI